MAALLIGYARGSTDLQDLTAQHDHRSELEWPSTASTLPRELMMRRVVSRSPEAAKDFHREVSVAVTGRWLAAVDLDMRRLPGEDSA